jgi:hypothetical protein
MDNRNGYDVKNRYQIPHLYHTYIYIYIYQRVRMVIEVKYNWDSSVGMANGYGLDVRDWIPGRRKKCFSTPQCPDQLWSPPSFISEGTWDLSSAVTGHEADHSPQYTAEIMNGGAILPPPPLHTSCWRDD